MARVLVLDVIGGKGLYEAECKKLDDFYRELKCDVFDIATRKIGGRYFDLFVDDCGRFVDNAIVSAMGEDRRDYLVGNIVIANHDSDGNTTSLTRQDIEIIKENVVRAMDKDGNEWDMIFPADY